MKLQTFFLLSTILVTQGLTVNLNNLEPIGRYNKLNEQPHHNEEDILKGINEMFVSGSPGFLSIYGNTTISILGGERWNWNPKVFHGLIAANRLGNGRIVGCSHTSLLSTYPESIEPGRIGTNQFILNSVRWASQIQNPNVLIIRTGGDRSLETFLNSTGMSAKSINPHEFTSSDNLAGIDIVLANHPLDNNLQAAILLQFVEQNGGGLVFALTAWAYSHYNEAPGHFGNVFPPNQISSKAGFVWRNGWNDAHAEPTTPSGNFNVSSVYIRNTNTGQVWPEVYKAIKGLQPSDEFNENPNQFISIVEMDLQAIPPQDPFFRVELYEQMREYLIDLNDQPIPTPQNPIKSDIDKLKTQVFKLLSDILLEPEEVKAHPASWYFPGSIAYTDQVIPQVHNVEVRFRGNKGFDQANSADSENKCQVADSKKARQPSHPFEDVIEMNRKHTDWFTTGLYAPAGRIITLRIISNTNPSVTYGVQIGCHTDDISRHTEWPRLPVITKRVQIHNNQNTSLASHYGGLIYITRPTAPTNETDEIILISIEGGNPAPIFKLGQTSLKAWRENIRYFGSPWAEFESEKVILAAPQTSAVQINDPESLLHFWDLVMDAIAELIQIPRERRRQERIVPDILISAGFMHSGYPIMTFLPEGDMAINVTRMRAIRNGWGHFHELGYNHHKSAWTFSGTGEVTCNLFALYIFNTVLGISAEGGHEMLTPEKYKPSVVNYIETGTQFTKWQSDPWLALIFYHQLQQEYGWESYKQTFAGYNNLGSDQQPGNDQEKIDLWLIMFSKVIGENLGPFFKSWGIPISSGAEEQVSYLPVAPIRITDMIK